jgi:hypothetical protein
MSSFCSRGKVNAVCGDARGTDQDWRHATAAGPPPHSKLDGDENGLVASTTNMTSWSRSVVPALKTSIDMSPAGNDSV